MIVCVLLAALILSNLRHSDVPWPFSLTAEIIQGDTLYQYTPCSSFSISIKRFPFLLFGVSSGTSQTEDVHFMLLQASCLVRLGNALLMDKSSTFVVKAIHVNHDYCATEYTLYKKGSGPDDKVVEYWKRSYNFSNRRDMFTLIFRIYNFLHSTRSLHDKFPSQLTMALASILTETENLPRLTRMHGSGSGSSKRWDQESRDPSTTRITLRNPGLQALIQTDGYTLLPEGSMQLKPTIGKALSNHGRAGTVALKLLDHATELQILSHLQTIQSELNHTIRLLDLIQLNIPPANVVRNVIVMPWQTPLARCLEEGYFPHAVEMLRIQFLEGVTFLHEHGIAHLDLKPENLLIDGERGSLSPRLSIIDFGLSVFAENEETLVEGFRGTPSWMAPEAGTEHGPVKKYSAILADRWSCGQVLKYFASFLPVGSASVLEFTCAGLLSLDPRKRPPLREVLWNLQGTTRAGKRSHDGSEANVVQKRLRVLW
ncbi:kinase-like domain-containing protein [Lactarius hatsudake]|nr:kinase-like domain-containing protein [Lactarius hatsudake]